MSTNRTCPACNSEVMQGDEYCASCGASLSGFWMNTWTSPPPRDSPAPGSVTDDDDAFFPLPLPPPSRRTSHRSRARIALIVGAVILLGALATAAIVITQLDDDDQEPQTSANGTASFDASVADVAEAAGAVIPPVAEHIEDNRELFAPATPTGDSAPGDVRSSAPRISGFASGSGEEGLVEMLLSAIDPVATAATHRFGFSPDTSGILARAEWHPDEARRTRLATRRRGW